MSGKWRVDRCDEGWAVTSPNGYLQDIANDWATAMRWAREYIEETSR